MQFLEDSFSLETCLNLYAAPSLQGTVIHQQAFLKSIMQISFEQGIFKENSCDRLQILVLIRQ